MASVQFARHDEQILEPERGEVEFLLEQMFETYRPAGEAWFVKHYRDDATGSWRLEFRRNGGEACSLTVEPTDWFLPMLEPSVSIFLNARWPLRTVS